MVLTFFYLKKADKGKSSAGFCLNMLNMLSVKASGVLYIRK